MINRLAARAVAAVSLSVAPGEIVVLIGRDGAGKTTAIRMLCGLIATTRRFRARLE